jgi:hypothetical protein
MTSLAQGRGKRAGGMATADNHNSSIHDEDLLDSNQPGIRTGSSV